MKNIEDIKQGIENFEENVEWAEQDCKEAMVELAKTLTRYAEEGNVYWFLAHIGGSAVNQIRDHAERARVYREKAALLRHILGE